MDQYHLSKRLDTVGHYIEEGAILADIGSDHAYLPAYLLLNKKITSAIAGEVVIGPYESAEKLVQEAGLKHVISVRLGDGLDVIHPEIDKLTAISICGMGGSLIKDILDRGYKANKLTGKEQLVLQPNVGERTLRKWLIEHDYVIEAETILEENNKKYEIIVARKGHVSQSLSEKELLFGPFLLKEKSPVFIKKWEHELAQLHHILKQLKASDNKHEQKIKEIEEKITSIEEVI